MKLGLFSVMFLLLFLPIASAQSTFDKDRVRSIIDAIATNNPNVIAEIVQFPVRRRYPLPSIIDESDFRSQYVELFDEKLVDRIRKSNPDTDWATVGWRGLMFGQGTLWVNSFSDYKILAINYETDLGVKHWQNLVDEQKKTLPQELRDFESPQLEFLSNKNRFRVDTVGTTYRLVRFPGKSMEDYDLIENNGILDFDGNIGDYHIDWKVNDKTYRVWVTSYTGRVLRTFAIYDSRTLEENVDTNPEYEEVEATKF